MIKGVDECVRLQEKINHYEERTIKEHEIRIQKITIDIAFKFVNRSGKSKSPLFEIYLFRLT